MQNFLTANMPWKKNTNLPGCRPLAPPMNFGNLFFFQTSVDDTGWLVGPYRDLTKFATSLRHEKILRDFLSANRIRIGLRNTDVPPTEIERQECYGTIVRGKDHDKNFTSVRLNPTAQPVSATANLSLNRKTDQEENVKNFWETQTPQSHHVVEFNNLKTLGVSRKRGNEGMDYFQLPAVLFAAEFHQRYISAILKPTQRLKKDELRLKISFAYQELYLSRGKLFEPLWSVSEAIIEKAGIRE